MVDKAIHLQVATSMAEAIHLEVATSMAEAMHLEAATIMVDDSHLEGQPEWSRLSIIDTDHATCRPSQLVILIF
jgi:hypothetical protein